MDADDLRQQIAVCMSHRENLEAIFNSVNDGIIAVDSQRQIVNLNQAALDITGWVREDVIGASCATVFQNPNGTDYCRLMDSVANGERFENREMEILRPDGNVRSLQVTTHILKNPEGVPQGVVAIFKDMTELQRLQKALRNQDRFERLIGRNHRMQEIYRLIEDVGDSDATVLISGESGTGKELVAEAIHRRTHRRDGPFVKVNCSALSESLLESELFGHVKGAFTGAIRDKKGRFELADGGTIFLDEIGDISPTVQVKLLRVLQEREFELVGGVETLKVDVRVIAASNQDLKEAIAEGKFREDLYYRLYVLPIELPPLRERKEDIPLLVAHFIERFKEQTGKPIESCALDVMALLMDHDWPGNIRELENAIEHAFVKCHDNQIDVQDLPLGLIRDVRAELGVQKETLSEKDQMLAALKQAGWNQSRAARILGMHRTTIWRKMKEYGIEVPNLI